MHSSWIFLFHIFGIATTHSLSKEVDQARAVCVVLCGNCRGFGLLTRDVCECNVNNTSDHGLSLCYEEAKKRAREQDMGWKLIYTDERRREATAKYDNYNQPLIHYQRGKRDVRSTPQLIYNPAYQLHQQQQFLQQQWVPPAPYVYRTQQPMPAPALYNINMGNDQNKKVEFVIPNSDSVEVKHEYIYSIDGKEYPYASPETEHKEPHFKLPSFEDTNSEESIIYTTSEEDTFPEFEKCPEDPSVENSEDSLYDSCNKGHSAKGDFNPNKKSSKRNVEQERTKVVKNVNQENSNGADDNQVNYSDGSYESGFNYATASMAN